MPVETTSLGQTKEFLDAILPHTDNLCLATLPKVNGTQRPQFRQQFFNRKNAEATTARQLERMRKNKNLNSYFAIAVFGDKSKGRKAKNAKYCRVLVMDVDIKQDDPKFFSSKVEVVPALKNLCKQVPSLPKPWVVDSGIGVHIYFALDKDLTPAEWSPLAMLFADVVRAVEPKLVADHKRTIDIAGVLRVPYTWNTKNGSETKVMTEGTVGILPDIRTDLTRVAAQYNATKHVVAASAGHLLPTPRPAYMEGVTDPHEMGKGMDDIKDYQLEALPLGPILDGCKQMREICEAHGNVPEPDWVLMLRVLATTRKPDEASQFFSNGHPSYNESEVRQKMRHIKKNFESPSAGCDEFDRERPGGCRGCPSRGSIWTPSQLGLAAEQKEAIEEAEEQALESAAAGETTEAGYIAQPDSVIQRTGRRGLQLRTLLPVARGAAGKPAVFTDEPCIHGHIHLKGSTERIESQMVNGRSVLNPKDRRVHLKIDIGRREVDLSIAADTLSAASANAATEQIRRVVPMDIKDGGKSRAINKYLNLLNDLSVDVVRPFYPEKGWVKDGPCGNWSFIAGIRRYDPDGSFEECVSIAEHLGAGDGALGHMEKTMPGLPTGQLQYWKKGMEVYGGNQYTAQMLLLSGLANLLLPLLTDNRGGILLSLTGSSGRGKTTLLKFLSSFMGRPKDYIVQGDATDAALGMLMRQAKCMLMAVDDTVTQSPTVLTHLLNMVTGGSDKARMKWDGKDGGTVDISSGFNASILLTSNFSTTDIIGRGGRNDDQLQTEAARSRTLEVDVDQIVRDSIEDEEWEAADALINQHYGHAAHHFLQYVVENQVSIRNALRKQRKWVRDQLRGKVIRSKLGTVRFWSQYLAIVNVTAYVLCHKLNILPWDYLKIRDAGIKVVGDTLEANALSDSDVVADMRSLLTQEPYPDAPIINHVTHTINSKRWTDARHMDGRGRGRHSEWNEGSGLGLAGKAPGGKASYAYNWRVDTYQHPEANDKQVIEQVVSIPIRHLRALVEDYRSNIRGAGLSDVQRTLLDGGCVINGMTSGKLSATHRVARRINQTTKLMRDNPLVCVEIIFPPITVSAED